MITCNKCGGRVLSEEHTDGGGIELSCVMCGRRRFQSQLNPSFYRLLREKLKARENGL